MRRRELLTSVLLATLAGRATAQTIGNLPLVGILSGANPRSMPWFVQFDKRLAELGWVDGETVSVLFRDPAGDPAQMDIQARELIAAGPAVIVATGPAATLEAVRRRSHELDIPVVAVAVDYDLVERGFVESLAEPGGNITGVMALPLEMTVKRMEVIREMLPDAHSVAVFVDPLSTDQLAPARTAAAGLGLELAIHRFAEPPYDFREAVAVAASESDALLLLASPVFARQRDDLVTLIAGSRLPLFAAASYAHDDGVLIAQGVSLPRLFSRAATFVDKLLRGATPASLPIDRSREFTLVVNLETAAVLGIDVPRSILLQADEIIE